MIRHGSKVVGIIYLLTDEPEPRTTTLVKWVHMKFHPTVLTGCEVLYPNARDYRNMSARGGCDTFESVLQAPDFTALIQPVADRLSAQFQPIAPLEGLQRMQ